MRTGSKYEQQNRQMHYFGLASNRYHGVLTPGISFNTLVHAACCSVRYSKMQLPRMRLASSSSARTMTCHIPYHTIPYHLYTWLGSSDVADICNPETLAAVEVRVEARGAVMNAWAHTAPPASRKAAHFILYQLLR